MIMSAGLRKLTLTIHVATSVGFLGAVACFLALAVVGLVSRDAPAPPAVYPAMDLITLYVIVPLNFASLLSGLVSSLGTQWGLFRHYWVVVKFLLTVPSTLILLVHLRPIAYLAHAAEASAMSGDEIVGTKIQLVAASALAFLVLLLATTLSIYKPRGLTPYGWRKFEDQRVL